MVLERRQLGFLYFVTDNKEVKRGVIGLLQSRDLLKMMMCIIIFFIPASPSAPPKVVYQQMRFYSQPIIIKIFFLQKDDAKISQKLQIRTEKGLIRIFLIEIIPYHAQ